MATDFTAAAGSVTKYFCLTCPNIGYRITIKTRNRKRGKDNGFF